MKTKFLYGKQYYVYANMLLKIKWLQDLMKHYNTLHHSCVIFLASTCKVGFAIHKELQLIK